MVRGLHLFKEHFASYMDCYALIGGTACAVVMEDAGMDFRVTKDLDIVLYVEALDKEFVKAFREFVRKGGYQNQQKSTGKKVFYRYSSPTNADLPFMLELFSRLPDEIELDEGVHLTPIPVEEEVTSLSAILLDSDSYRFVQEGKVEIGGLSLVGPEHLIPLKARAWIDLCDRRKKGEKINTRNIRKHRNDILRLYLLLSSDTRILLPDLVKQDMESFVELIKNGDIDLECSLKR